MERTPGNGDYQPPTSEQQHTVRGDLFNAFDEPRPFTPEESEKLPVSLLKAMAQNGLLTRDTLLDVADRCNEEKAEVVRRLEIRDPRALFEALGYE